MVQLQERLRQVALLFRLAKSAVAFTGAGISTSSGIPDFRSPTSGLWTHVDPMAVASIYGFRQNPQAFYDWVYPLVDVTHNAQPNAAHRALADLEARGRLKTLITQNIDMLHTRAGSKTLYELHGHLREATCTHCFQVFPAEPILQRFLQDRQVPRCPTCRGVIKPNVILFGEQLPYDAFQPARDAARRADLMLVVGSSLEVYPAAELPMLALRNQAKLVIINLEPTHLDTHATTVIHGDAAEILPEIVRLVEAS